MRTLNCEKGRLVNNHRSVFVDLCFSMLTKEHCLSSSFPLSCAFQCLLKSIAGSLLSSLPSTCASQCLLKSIVSRVTYRWLVFLNACWRALPPSLSSSLSFDLYFSMLAKEHCRPLFRAPFGLVLSSECCKRALASSFRLLFRAPFVVNSLGCLLFVVLCVGQEHWQSSFVVLCLYQCLVKSIGCFLSSPSVVLCLYQPSVNSIILFLSSPFFVLCPYCTTAWSRAYCSLF